MRRGGGKRSKSVKRVEQQQPVQQNDSSPLQNNLATPDLLKASMEAKIYADKKSPYAKAPKKIKKLLLQAKNEEFCLDLNKIDLSKIVFEPKPTLNNLCLYHFQEDEDQYYHCYECTGSSHPVTQVIFCTNCFNPQNHIGHNYFSEKCTKREDFCDCGSLAETNPKYSCSKHNQKYKIDFTVDNKDRQEFMSMFKTLLETCCYVDSFDEFFQELIKKIRGLCNNSAYYSKLVLQLLLMESQSCKVSTSGSSSSYYLSILLYYDQGTSLIFAICANDELHLELIQFISQKMKQIMPFFIDFVKSTVFNVDALTKLAVKGKYINSMFDVYQKFATQTFYRLDGQKLFASFLEQYFEDKNNHNFTIQNKIPSQLDQIVTQEIAWIYLKNFINYYPEPNKRQQKNAKKQSKRKKKVKQQISPIVCKLHDLIMQSIIVITNGDYKKLQNIRQIISSQGINLKKFQIFLSQISHFASQFIYSKQKTFISNNSLGLISLLLLINGSENRTQLMDMVWLSILAQDFTFQNLIVNIYQLMSAVAWMDEHFAISQGTINELIKNKTSKFISEQHEKNMKQFFTRLLSINQIISKSYLIQIFNQKQLQFSNMGKILRTVCNYNKSDETFQYIAQPIVPRFQDSCPFFTKQTNIEKMRQSMEGNTLIYFGFQDNLAIADNVQKLYNMMFNSKIVMQIIDNGWINIQKMKNPQPKIGFMYLFIQILIDGVTHGSNVSLRQKLIQLKKSPEKLKQYSKSQSELTMLHRIFRIQLDKPMTNGQQNKQAILSIQSQLQQQNQQKVQQKKRKFEQKKKKLQEKYSQKRNLILETIKSKTIDGQLPNDQDICMTCHQRNHPDNQLIYPGRIVIDNSLCRAVNGEQDKANTSVFICFHTLHINCFKNLHKNSRNHHFKCPLCSLDINCFLPRDFNTIDQALMLAFSNFIVFSMIHNFKFYESEHYFILFFKHLVQSKGLKSLITSAENYQKHKLTDKSDYFIQKSMINIYDECSSQEKQKYLKMIQNFISKIQTCQSQPRKLVQLIVSNALKQKLCKGPNSEPDIVNLIKLQKCLKQQQFMIIKQRVQSITGDKITQIPQQLSVKPVSEPQNKQSLAFMLKQLPRDSTLFPLFISSNPCHNAHRRRADYYCLICGKGICQQCNDQKQQLQHFGVSAYLRLEDFMLVLKNYDNDTQGQLYYNDLKVGYSQCGNYDMENQVFTLDVLQLSALLEEFMGQ